MKHVKQTLWCMLLTALLLSITVGCGLVEDSAITADAERPTATISVKDKGDIVIELYPEYAPNTVKNFITLAETGFYDGLRFHRVIYQFMIQAGDPTGTGMGGPGYTIKGEFKNNGFKKNILLHTRGVISMAHTAQDMDSAGSQFFICQVDLPELDGGYAAFGRVIEGMEIVDAIAKVATQTDSTTGQSDIPVNDQTIVRITIERNGYRGGEPKIIRAF